MVDDASFSWCWSMTEHSSVFVEDFGYPGEEWSREWGFILMGEVWLEVDFVFAEEKMLNSFFLKILYSCSTKNE